MITRSYACKSDGNILKESITTAAAKAIPLRRHTNAHSNPYMGKISIEWNFSTKLCMECIVRVHVYYLMNVSVHGRGHGRWNLLAKLLESKNKFNIKRVSCAVIQFLVCSDSCHFELETCAAHARTYEKAYCY